jgi:hypothetical protein
MYIRADRVAAVSERELFREAADHAADFVETLDTRPIRAEADVEELFAAFGGVLPEEGSTPTQSSRSSSRRRRRASSRCRRDATSAS